MKFMKNPVIYLTFMFLGLATVAQAQTEEIKWYSLKEAMELNKTNPKKILIDVYTKWCGPCKMMMAYTFTDPVVIKTVNKYFYAVKFNAEGNDTITFHDKTFYNQAYDPNATGRNNTHDFTMYIAPVNGQIAYPTIVYFDETYQYIQGIQGYLQPAQIEPILKFFGTDTYRSTKWETYMSTFQSELK